MHVHVEPYNPLWPIQFEAIKSELEALLASVPYIGIEHVGSTSVPGLAAKPIIDIDIVVQASQLAAVLDTLASPTGGYTYHGEWGIPDRHALRKSTATPTRNLYVCIEGSRGLRNHLAVRDLCRGDEEVRERYGRVKLELSNREWMDLDEYCEAKNDVVGWILERAGVTKDDRDKIQQESTRVPVVNP